MYLLLFYFSPDIFVYFDVKRQIYFYLEKGSWHVSTSLPSFYKGKLKGYVVIELNTDKPYIYFDEHKKKYPPGQWKKHTKKPNN